MVTNQKPTPPFDFTTASKEEIESRFRYFANMEYDVHAGLMHWLNAAEAPELFPGVMFR